MRFHAHMSMTILLAGILAAAPVSSRSAGAPAREAHRQQRNAEAERIEAQLFEIRDALQLNQVDEALGLLDTFDAQLGASSEAEAAQSKSAALRFSALSSKHKQNPELAAASDWRLLVEPYGRIKAHSESELDRYREEGNWVGYATDTGHLQSFMLEFGELTARRGDVESALQIFEDAAEVYDSSREHHDDTFTSIVIRGGVREESAVKIREIEGLRSGEQTLRVAIGSMRRMTVGPPDGVMSTLLTRYLSEYPGEPWAGVFTDEKMRLDGRFDLDRLVAAYDRIEDKTDRQYLFSLLGLANYLISAGRYGDALAQLEHIKSNGVSDDQLAEFQLAMADAFLGLGNESEALRRYITVMTLTDRFQSAQFHIDQILGGSTTDRSFVDAIKRQIQTERDESEPSPETGARPGGASADDGRAGPRRDAEPVASSGARSKRTARYIAAFCVVMIGLLAFRFHRR